MSEYGVFANVVAIAGCLAAAAGALRLAWMKRSDWQPPEEEVPDAVGRVASLCSMVVIAILYVFGATGLGLGGLAWLAAGSFALTLLFLALSIYVNRSRVFLLRKAPAVAPVRVLGGFSLTEEAASIRKKKKLNEQQMFDDAQGDKDLVWTKSSQAMSLIASAISYVGLIASGTTAVAAAANLVALAVSAQTGA